MNILVTGANGQLGMEIRKRSQGSSDRYIFTDVSELPGIETVHLDITDRQAIKIVADSEMVDVIINCAAYTNVEKAEEDTVFADLLNHKAAENLAWVCKERGAVLIHVSTDYVFSGTAFQPLKETDTPNPCSVYGSTKLAGEKAVINSGCKYLIFRTAWLYSPYGKNFVKTMLNLTETKSSINVVSDQIGTPTYAGDLADAILFAINKDKLDNTGIYHFTDEGVCSWYDLADAVCVLSKHKCKVQPCSSDEFPTKVKRPFYSVLDKKLVKDTFGIKIPHWQVSLKTCLKEIEKQNQ